MKMMKVILIEDELHNYKLLRGLIEALRPDWVIEAHFTGVKNSVDWLNKNPHPDLIFMDIQLADGNCFSIFKQVELDSSVIFTTAYDEYAIQAFKVNSIDYLLKPIKSEELERAILKFEKLVKQSEQKPIISNYTELLEAIHQQDKKYRKRFLITGSTAFSKLNVEDIAYIYTDNRVTFAMTFENKEYILNQSLDKLEEELDPEIFFRANRGLIINSESIQKIENYFGGKLIVQLVHPFDKEVTVSRLKASAFKDWLDR